MPTQIYPIDSFDFINKNPLYDKFKEIKEFHGGYIFKAPPIPLNLLSNTNYLRYYVNNDTLINFKDLLEYISGIPRFYKYKIRKYMFPQITFPFGKAPDNQLAPRIYYQDPVTNKELMPAVVSHPYFFKFILSKICKNQLAVEYNNELKRYVYTRSNDIFSMNGNQLTISFINQFTEGKPEQEVIDLRLDQSAILEVLNYDFSKNYHPSSVRQQDINLLNKWKDRYDMLDNWYEHFEI